MQDKFCITTTYVEIETSMNLLNYSALNRSHKEKEVNMILPTRKPDYERGKTFVPDASEQR